MNDEPTLTVARLVVLAIVGLAAWIAIALAANLIITTL